MKNKARALGYEIFLALQDEKKSKELISLFNLDKESLIIACERGLILTINYPLIKDR